MQGSLRIKKSHFSIGGMQCSFCTTTLSEGISGINGVSSVNINIGNGEMLVGFDPDLVGENDIERTVRKLGYTIRDRDKVKGFEQSRQELRITRNRFIHSIYLTIPALVFLVLFREGVCWLLQRLVLMKRLASMV